MGKTGVEVVNFGGQDDGIWRRLILLRFGRKFEGHEKDPELEGKLLQERDGILMWMLEGCKKYLKDGLKLSPSMRAEWTTYRNESDLLGEFLADETDLDPVGRVLQGDLFVRWQRWCESNGVRCGSKKSFTQRMTERGHGESKSGGSRFYGGLRLKVANSLVPSQGGVGRM